MKIQKIVKRLFDFLLALFGLIVLSPVFLIISILIKLDFSGPVFFLQERVGEKGKIFRILKFRTMPVNSDNPDLQVAKVREFEKEGEDPRVTSFNRFLRRFALDELPQLINILRGDMSFVGPKPYFLPRIKLNPELLKDRTTVKPGLTSLAVIKGGVRLSEDELLKLDLEYIKNQSFFGDIKILLKSIFLVISGRGFYGK